MHRIIVISASIFIGFVVFLLTAVVFPNIGWLVESFGPNGGSYLGLGLGVLSVVAGERLSAAIDGQKETDNINSIIDELGGACSSLMQSETFNQFFIKSKESAKSLEATNINGVWIAFRNDLRQNKKCIYIFTIKNNGSEIVFQSFDENTPGETFVVSGVSFNVAIQIILIGNVVGENSLHVNALFRPQTREPQVLFGTHFQTTLAADASLATSIVMLRVSEKKYRNTDLNAPLAQTGFVARHGSIAKRHDANSWREAITYIQREGLLNDGPVGLERIEQFLENGGSSVSVKRDRLDELLGLA